MVLWENENFLTSNESTFFPRTWLPLDAAILHYSETFMLAFIVTPKSFSFMAYLE